MSVAAILRSGSGEAAQRPAGSGRRWLRGSAVHLNGLVTAVIRSGTSRCVTSRSGPWTWT